MQKRLYFCCFLLALVVSLSAQSASATIDFTDPTTETFGTDARVIRYGVLLMPAGDANRDGQANAVDANGHWRLANGLPFLYGLLSSDFNLDGVVNAVDINSFWRLNNSRTTQVPTLNE